MADSKESPKVPEEGSTEVGSGSDFGVANTVEPSGSTSQSEGAVEGKPERDEVLEGLLRSKSSDDEDTGATVGATPAGKKRDKKLKPTKTGTSLDKKAKRSLPLVAAALAGVIVLGGGGVATWMALSPESDQIDVNRNDGKKQKIGTGNSGEQPNPEDEDASLWRAEDGGTVFPIELSEWQQSSGKNGVAPEQRAAIVEELIVSDLGSNAGTLPSEAAGFTSDDTKIVNEDGSVNPFYSFWTQESFTADSGQIVEKFLNPRFGDWEIYQGRGLDPNGINAEELFPRTFTDDALKSSEPVSAWLPIYADWGNNSYGRNDLSATGPRWYGEVTGSKSDFTWDEERSQYNVSLRADVTFKAYKSSGEIASEKGVLNLELVANPSGERGSGGKVLVNKSSLTIGG